MAAVDASEVQDAPALRFSGCIRNENSGLQAELFYLKPVLWHKCLCPFSANTSIEMLTPKMMVPGGLWEVVRTWALALINEISDLIKEAPEETQLLPSRDKFRRQR